MEFTTEELQIVFQALRSMTISGRPQEVAAYYNDKVKPLEVKLADELEKRKQGKPVAPALVASQDGKRKK